MRASTTKTVLAALLCGAAFGAGCSPKVPSGEEQGVFVAQTSDFQGFHDWQSAPAMPATTLPPVDGGDGIDAGAVTLGDAGTVHNMPLTVYWNSSPPHGSTTFPVGTIIVKETSEADITARKIFSMVKRGGDFNPNGAVNWEWFELQNLADGSVSINWDGAQAPGGMDVYSSNPNLCNECHLKAAANDDVWSSALQLSNF
jgi:hypothetical protein